MSSTLLWLAASCSTKSIARPSMKERQDSHLLQGSPSTGAAQFAALASRRPSVVLPVPRGPQKRYACAKLPEATALRRVRVTASWPATSAKDWGRHLR